MDDGIKENEGKLTYELCWRFVSAMAERMAKNKGKYEPFNWKKPMDVNELIQGTMRHQIEIMEGNFEDDGDEDDLRFLDDEGVIVGLTAKGDAKKDLSGFVI